MTKQALATSSGISATALAKVLCDHAYTVADLLRWLQGLGFCQLSDDEEPVVFIADAMCFLGDREKERAEHYLAVTLAELFKQCPDKWLNAATELSPRMREAGVLLPETALVNALWLASQLKRPSVLSEPIHELFLRQRKSRTLLLRELFRSALIGALIDNQVDDRMLMFWNELAVNGVSSDGLFSCCTTDCVDGIFNLVDAMVPILQPSDWRRFESRRLLEAYETGPLASNHWSEDFVRRASRRKWPEWVLESFPGSLMLSVADKTYYVWTKTANAIPRLFLERPIQSVTAGLDAIELRKSVSAEQLREFFLIAGVLDNKRSSFGDVSDDAFEDDFREVLKDLTWNQQLSEATRQHFKALHTAALAEFHESICGTR